MIWRAGGAIATQTTAVVAAAEQGAHVASPTVWQVLGVPFEAGSMIAALCACAAVRFYVGQTSGAHRWIADAPVSALALMFTAGAVIRLHPDPILALVYGTLFGILGAGIIVVVKNKMDKLLELVGLGSVASSGKEPT